MIPPTLAANPSLDRWVSFSPDGTVQLNCTGAPSAYYLIQATTNLGDPSAWSNISTNMTDNTGSIQWIDTDAVNHQFRYIASQHPERNLK